MTPAQKILRRLEDNKLVSFAVVIGVVVIAISSFTDAVQKLVSLFFPHPKPKSFTPEEFISALEKSRPPIAQKSPEPLPEKLQQRFDRELEKLRKEGFAFPLDYITYPVEAPTVIKFMYPTTKGLQYAIVAGGNAGIRGIRAAFFNEDGNRIDSAEGDRQISIKQLADYTGTLECFIQVTDVDAIGQLNVAVGRRGVERDVGPLGSEPTFKMESAPPRESPNDSPH